MLLETLTRNLTLARDDLAYIVARMAECASISAAPECEHRNIADNYTCGVRMCTHEKTIHTNGYSMAAGPSSSPAAAAVLLLASVCNENCKRAVQYGRR